MQAEDSGLTLVRHHEGGENAEERGLPSAIRPDEAEQLPIGDLERDAGQRGRLTEALHELPDDDRRTHDAFPRAPADALADGGVRATSAGMPIFNSPCAFGTSTLIAYTRSARSSRV